MNIQMFIHPNGDIIYYTNNGFDKEDGPAYIGSDGINEWYLYGRKCNVWESTINHFLLTVWKGSENENYNQI
jgi:hypothetical protein